MKVKVKRVTHSEFDSIKRRLGVSAVPVLVPSTTSSNVSFSGVYTDLLKQTVAVAWPVDRPQHAQQDFADNYCEGSWPVDYIERKRSNKLGVVN